MKYTVKYYKRFKNSDYSEFVLGGDVGGTNTNFGIAGVRKGKSVLLFSVNFKSGKLNSIVPAVSETLKYAKVHHEITIDNACIGGAGVVTDHNYCELTNLPWNIDSEEIVKKTKLRSVFIVNDFEVIGYAINILDPKKRRDLIVTSPGRKPVKGATKVVLGAGTGLGKAILVYNPTTESHYPIPSEGGHSDFPPSNEFELGLVEYIRNKHKHPQVGYEELLAGKGIESIYSFLRSEKVFKATKHSREIDAASDKVPLISKYRKKDSACKETFDHYTRFYARCAKNFALDGLARGGVYIAGGIAARVPDIFKSKEFFDEFGLSRNQPNVLKEMPVYVIVNYDVSLLGACFAAMSVTRW